MDTSVIALIAVLVAIATFIFNASLHLFGGGWKLSNRLTKIEASVLGMQEEIRKLTAVLREIADMRGDIRVLDTRLVAAEQDIRELRHGDGFVRNVNPNHPGVNKQYP